MSARATRPFSRDSRIRGQAAIDAIRQQGSRVGSSRFVFLVHARAHGGPPRLGITVSRRYGNAVARNRFKRLMREAFRRLPGLLAPGTDLMVMARTGAAKSPVGAAPGSTRSPRTGLAAVLDEWRAAEGKIRKRAAELHDRLASAPDRTQTAPAPTPSGGRARRPE